MIMNRKANERYLLIEHGRLTIQVPLSIFRGTTAIMDERRLKEFRAMLASRYPWLSNFALDVILENARIEMNSRIRNLRTPIGKAGELMDWGAFGESLRLLDSYLIETNSAQAWDLRGEVLIRMGKKEEGYRSFRQTQEVR